MEEYGLFLYCIGDCNTMDTDLIGIDGVNPVFAIAQDGLYAYVSKVDLNEYGQDSIDARLEDIRWIKDKAECFMQVIKFISEHMIVIPMKFCTIFASRERLLDMMKHYCDGWNNTMNRLRGKQEWSFKIYCDMILFSEQQMAKEREEMEKKLLGKPKGAAFFLRKKMEESMHERCQDTAMKLSNVIFDEACQYVEDFRMNKLLAKEISGREEQMMINAALLVDNNNLKEFIEGMNKLREAYKSRFFIIDYLGPWPLYNFIDNSDET